MNYEQFYDADSEPLPSNRTLSELIKVFERVIPSIEQKLNEEIGSQIRQRIKDEKRYSDKLIAELTELIITSLIDKVDNLKSIIEMDVTKADYQILETAVQKAEGQIRNHIRIEQQIKLYLDSLEEKIEQLEIKLKQTERKNNTHEETIERYETQQKDLLKKISKLEEKLYEINREGKWDSCDKKSYDQLMHKASLNLRERSKIQPYLSNYSKSKQLMTRIKQKPKNMKVSLIAANFESLNYARSGQCSDSHLQTRKQHHKISSDQSFKQLGTSIQMSQLQKRRKKRFSKYLTEAAEKKQANSSLFL